MPYLSWGVCLMLAAIFLAEQHWQLGHGRGSALTTSSLFAMGGLYPPFVLRDGEWQRLFTAVLLHLSLRHMVTNCLVLMLAGTVLEAVIGRWWFAALFMLGGLAGSVMSMAVAQPDTVSAGASGAIMCLLAAALVLTFRFPMTRKRLLLQARLAFFLVPALGTFSSPSTSHGIDYGAHVGGFICGTTIGLILCVLWPRHAQNVPLKRLAMVLCCVGLYAYVFAGFLAVLHYPDYAEQYRWGQIKL